MRRAPQVPRVQSRSSRAQILKRDRRSDVAAVPAFNHIPRYSTRAWVRLPLRGRRPDRREQYLRQLQEYRQQLAADRDDRRVPHGWLLPAREDLRRLLADHAAPTVHRLLLTGDADLCPFCIALLSRVANRFQLCGIQHFRHDPSPAVRKHVAKALRRLEAWQWLDEMARAHPDDRFTQWCAGAPRVAARFSIRLQRFIEHQQALEPGARRPGSRMPFWRRDAQWHGKPPKAASHIRRLLLRIRRLVHGETDDRQWQ